jgi:protease-4
MKMCIITPSKALKVEKEDYNKVSIFDYTKKWPPLGKYWFQNQIAIIYAQGEIQSGEGDVNTIGEGSMRRSLQEARKTKMLKLLYFVLEEVLHQI